MIFEDVWESNQFQWSCVSTNFLGTWGYKPGMSWFIKFQEKGQIGCDMFAFLNNERLTVMDWDLA